MTAPNGLRAGRERVGQQIADVDQEREHSTHHTSEHGTDDDADDDLDDGGHVYPAATVMRTISTAATTLSEATSCARAD